MTSRLSIIALILANSVPLAGVIWLDWEVFDVMMLYWAENVVIGVINVMRMLASQGEDMLPMAGIRFVLIPFFILHYGMFCFGHYMAVVSLFGRGEWQSPLWFGVAAVAISHLISFRINFIGAGEFKRCNLIQLMQRPYGRIIVLHISIIAGGFLVVVMDNPFWMLPVLVVVKTVIDLRMHLAERRVLGVAISPN